MLLSYTHTPHRTRSPCYDTLKHLAVKLSGPKCAAPPLFTVGATVPVGGAAKVRVPTMAAGSSAVIRESGVVVWQAGAFVPGVPGITAASSNGDNVLFTVGSGSYSFVVFAA